MTAVITGVGRAVPEPRTVRLVGLPVEVLVDRIRPMAEASVDRYEIAAGLESDGITDEVARERYACADVFALACEVERRVARRDPPGPITRAAPDVDGPWRDVTHGLLYLVPTLVYPVGLALLQRSALLYTVIAVSGLGWVWSAVAGWLAWQFRAVARPRTAGVVLAVAAVSVLPVSALAGLLLVPAGHDPVGVIVLAVALTAFQMASTLLTFHRREGVLFATIAPGAVAGVALLLSGRDVLPAALAVAACAVAAGYAAGLWCALHAGASGSLPEAAELPAWPVLRGLAPRLPAVAAHAVASAAFLLQVQAQFVRGGVAVLLAFLPLVAGLGVVEWRARRFTERARAQLGALADPRRFRRRVLALFARDAGICAGTVGGLMLLLGGVLALTGALRPGAVVLGLACTVLAVGYLAAFLLANAGRLRFLAAAFGVAAGLHLATRVADLWLRTPLADATAVLAASVLLVLLLLGAIFLLSGEPETFR